MSTLIARRAVTYSRPQARWLRSNSMQGLCFMPITTQQLQLAQADQQNAAHDARPQVRLIAGPGTGKSFTIEDRVAWLLQNGANGQRIFAISFTNASAQDLRLRVAQYCQSLGLDGSSISVTTMHSLALRMLRVAGLLQRFPAPPTVIDQWEISNVFIPEFCSEFDARVSRADDIRRDHEAYWSTGRYDPPNYIPPAPPISAEERAALSDFLVRFEQVYSCILPGEIVRECVEQIRAGVVIPRELIVIDHLIVDEYQDLNPIDLEYIAALTGGGAVTFVAGDDDQSIYSFRFALPQGIQNFTRTYPNSGDHVLRYCFRCSTAVLAAARAVVTGYPSVNRVPKDLTSVYAASAPPVVGSVLRWNFQNGAAEARAVAQSCRALINAGMEPSDILILISDRNILEAPIIAALTGANVPFGSRSEEISSDEGRVLYDLIRIGINPEDYIAHRSLLGLLPGVGLGTCTSIKEKVLANNLNYRNVFYGRLPNGVVSPRESAAIKRLADVCAQVAGWTEDDTLAVRGAELAQVSRTFGDATQAVIAKKLASLPETLTIGEFRELLVSSSDEVKVDLLTDAYQRLGVAPPPEAEPTSKVRIMTMHGAKGLSARAVFIPGLEEEVFPGHRRRPYPGLVEEAARLLYVSITRARAACVMSFARRRVVHGRLSTPHRASINPPAASLRNRLMV
jgi:DNA helicase-2/ATP-dependent DNA helicase PcrA